MARTRIAKHPKSERPAEEIPPEEPPDDWNPASTPPANDNGQPPAKKADLVRQVLAEGITTPAEGVARIKQLFGVEMPKPLWSSYVAGFKRREGGGAPRTRSAAPQPAGIPSGFTADVTQLRALIIKAGGKEALLEILSGPLPTLTSKYGQSGLLELIEALG